MERVFEMKPAKDLVTLMNRLRKSSEDFKIEYIRRALKRTKKELIQNSLEIALVCELPFVVDKVDSLLYDTELLYACDPDKISYDTWMRVINAEIEPRADGNYDMFDTSNGNDVKTVMGELRDAIESQEEQE